MIVLDVGGKFRLGRITGVANSAIELKFFVTMGNCEMNLNVDFGSKNFSTQSAAINLDCVQFHQMPLEIVRRIEIPFARLANELRNLLHKMLNNVGIPSVRVPKFLSAFFAFKIFRVAPKFRNSVAILLRNSIRNHRRRFLNTQIFYDKKKILSKNLKTQRKNQSQQNFTFSLKKLKKIRIYP